MNKYTIIDFLFPPKCTFCGKIVQRNVLCEHCINRVKAFKIGDYSHKININSLKNIDECIAFYYYDDIIKLGMHHAKFVSCDGFIRDFLKYIDFDFAEYFKENKVDEIISMPFYKSKLYNKEYDLPNEMVKKIAKSAGIEYNKSLVSKIKSTKNQHNLSKQERKVNLKDAFKVNEDVKGKNVVIIDDIITTGYSMEEVAATLKRRGANKVIGIAFAYNK